jgi:hypothetical protein
MVAVHLPLHFPIAHACTLHRGLCAAEFANGRGLMCTAALPANATAPSAASTGSLFLAIPDQVGSRPCSSDTYISTHDFASTSAVANYS